MTRRLTIISLLLIFCINLSSYSNSIYSPKETFAKKVYIILRSEQKPEELLTFKTLVHDNLQHNNVTSQIDTYRVNQAIPQMKIFKNAYQQDFDFILLIDQVAKYNVGIANKKVTVGGKFQIQSYYMKSSNPTWKNHGDTNCNITVDASVKQFSKRILSSIQQDANTFYNISYAETASVSSDYVASSNSKTSPSNNESNKEKELLNKQLELQKTKTKRIQSEIELLILKANKELVLETEKLKNIQSEIQKLKQ